jgi:hypothetical protein
MDRAFEIAAWATGISAVATLLCGLVLYVLGALMEGGIIGRRRAVQLEKLRQSGVSTEDDDLRGGIRNAIRDALKVLFGKKRYRPGQRLEAAGVLLIALAMTLLILFVGALAGAAATDGDGNGGTTATSPTTTTG